MGQSDVKTHFTYGLNLFAAIQVLLNVINPDDP